MVIRNKVWEELKQAHVNILYTDIQRKYERYYQCFIAFTASAGTFGYIIEEWLPLVSSMLIAFVSVVKSLFPQFIQPDTFKQKFKLLVKKHFGSLPKEIACNP